MSTLPALSNRIIPPDGGRVIQAFGGELIVHLGGEETGGQFTLATIVTPPGDGPPLHCHEREDECFLPLSGRVEFFQDGAWTEVPVGTVVYLPKGSVHTFRNPGTETLRMLVQAMPSGFETFFARCAEEFAKLGGPDFARIETISAEHGIHYLPPPASDSAPGAN